MPVDQQLTAQAAHPIDSRTQAIYDLHSAAQRLYQHILLNTTSGETALAYLHDKATVTRCGHQAIWDWFCAGRQCVVAIRQGPKYRTRYPAGIGIIYHK